MNAHLNLIEQAYAAADEIYANDNSEDGWDRIFKLMTRLGVKLDDLDAVEAQVPAEEVA